MRFFFDVLIGSEFNQHGHKQSSCFQVQKHKMQE